MDLFASTVDHQVMSRAKTGLLRWVEIVDVVDQLDDYLHAAGTIPEASEVQA